MFLRHSRLSLTVLHFVDLFLSHNTFFSSLVEVPLTPANWYLRRNSFMPHIIIITALKTQHVCLAENDMICHVLSLHFTHCHTEPL